MSIASSTRIFVGGYHSPYPDYFYIDGEDTRRSAEGAEPCSPGGFSIGWLTFHWVNPGACIRCIGRVRGADTDSLNQPSMVTPSSRAPME